MCLHVNYGVRDRNWENIEDTTLQAPQITKPYFLKHARAEQIQKVLTKSKHSGEF